jgi:anti-sigma factor RsiW
MDAILVAYLDGELEPQAHEEIEQLLKSDASVRERLATLSRGARPFPSSFEALLKAAPNESLQSMLEASISNFTSRNWLTRFWQWRIPIAAAPFLLIGGGIAGYFLGQLTPNLSGEEAWLDAVAKQVSLYSRETVSSVPVNETAQQAELSRLGEMFNLDFSQARVELPGLTLKRVELLRFEGRPLGQLLYEGDYGIIALCVMAQPGEESEREAERRADLNTLYWTSGNYRFLLVSRAPASAMENIADVLESRFARKPPS